MARWVAIVLAAAGALSSGCVVAYDPGAPPRLGVGEQAPVRVVEPPVGRAPVMAAAPVRVTPAPAPVVASAPAPAASAPPAAIPETPAGRQMEWLVEVLGGGELRKL